MANIFKLPSPLDVLFCWQQLGDSNIVKQYYAAATRDNISFLRGLDALRGWSNSSATGVNYPIRDGVVELFTEPNDAHARLQTLAKDRRTKQKANDLLKAWAR
jgi:hypothetical protein